MFTRKILMGNNKEKNQDPTMNSSSVYYLHPTDMGLKLVTNIFRGVGFKGWKRVMFIAYLEKIKWGLWMVVLRDKQAPHMEKPEIV